MAAVTLDGVVRSVDERAILDRVTFRAEDGEFVALIGPSGAGKTSVIRAIAGFDQIEAGTIHFGDRDVTRVPTRERDVGLVSQQNTLFPTQRVRRNLLFPLLARGMRRDEAHKRVEAESRANDLERILDRWPATLSAGEQRLTQIARALLRRPRVFLMDEPLANLDAPTRSRLRHELVSMQQGYGVTTIYVANRADEIMTMPDRVIALEHGRVVQIGTPVDMHRQPATLSIGRLLGEMATIDAKLTHDGSSFRVEAPGLSLRVAQALPPDRLGESVTIGVRSGDVRIQSGGPLSFSVGPVAYEGNGSTVVRVLECPAGAVRTVDADLAESSRVSARFDHFVLFDGSGRAI